MENGFFVGFDNDMEDFSNLVGGGKLSQKYKDLKTATGGKNIIGAGIKAVVDPKKTLNKLSDIKTARANAPTPPTPPTMPDGTTTPSGGGTTTASGSMSDDAGSTESGSSSGNTKSTDSGEGNWWSNMGTGGKIGIIGGGVVVLGTIAYFIFRRKK